MEASRSTVVHMLGSRQQELARKFLETSRRETDRLNGEPFTEGKLGSPVLTAAPAYIECSVRQIIDDGGDHALVVMEVVEAEYRQDVDPLLIADTAWRYGG